MATAMHCAGCSFFGRCSRDGGYPQGLAAGGLGGGSKTTMMPAACHGSGSNCWGCRGYMLHCMANVSSTVGMRASFSVMSCHACQTWGWIVSHRAMQRGSLHCTCHGMVNGSLDRNGDVAAVSVRRPPLHVMNRFCAAAPSQPRT